MLKRPDVPLQMKVGVTRLLSNTIGSDSRIDEYDLSISVFCSTLFAQWMIGGCVSMTTTANEHDAVFWDGSTAMQVTSLLPIVKRPDAELHVTDAMPLLSEAMGFVMAILAVFDP